MRGPDQNGWTDDDYRTLIREAYSSQYQPEDFLAFATNESGLRVQRATPSTRGVGPFALNDNGGARGLWQAMPSILANLGWRAGDPDFDSTSGEFRELGVSGQLRWFSKYVEDWRKRLHFGPFRDGGSLYLLNFTPAYLPHKDEPGFRLFDSNRPREARTYEVNKGLDRTHKGWIEVQDLRATVDACRFQTVYLNAVRSLNKLAQAGLNARGATLDVDGNFGALSCAAFRSWSDATGGTYRALDGSARFALL